jgi:hypothetical protein
MFFYGNGVTFPARLRLESRPPEFILKKSGAPGKYCATGLNR